MTIIGVIPGLLVALVLMIPVILLVVTGIVLPGFPLLDHAMLLAVRWFFALYPYCIISAYVFHWLLGLLSRALDANPDGRRLATTILAIVYLVLTISWFAFVFAGGVVTALLGVPPAITALVLPAVILSTGPHFVAVLICYLLASISTPSLIAGGRVDSPLEQFFRGMLIGINSGLNFVLGMSSFGVLLFAMVPGVSVIFALVISLALALIPLLTSVMPTSFPAVNAVIRFIAGWTGWLLPTAWTTVVIGWMAFVLNLCLHLILGTTRNDVRWLFAIHYARLDWDTGSMVIEGGLFGTFRFQPGQTAAGVGQPSGDSAYNLGCFTFQHAALDSPPALLEPAWLSPANTRPFTTPLHEAGHNLNLTAFGSWFHLINLVDENIFPKAGANAYAEKLAEGNRQAAGWTYVPSWMM